MTTPVFTAVPPVSSSAAASSAAAVTMSFPMQRSLGSDPSALPAPVERTVSREAVPGRVVAAARFSGVATDADAARAERALREGLLRDGHNACEGYELARYNDPSTPGPFRRNEILIQLEGFEM